ncbi:MAG: orotidine-5'-phosphate decarboxylase [Bacteroidota bacterium]
MNYSKIEEEIRKKKSFLCIGLDSDIAKIPSYLLNYEDPIFEFNKLIIDATYDLAISYKPNIAFYETNGSKGWQSLDKTCEFIKNNHPEIFVIADAKRGDIGNTSLLYASAFFKNMAFDAVTVAPYMGKDSVSPFLEYKDKWVILLALTSNEGAFDFQLFEDNKGKKLYEQVLLQSQNWADKNQMMYVVGATKAEMLQSIRQIVPDHFLLIPGIGAQGGNLEDVVKYGINKNCGLIVNNSRGIIFAGNDKNFDMTARTKAMEMQKQMRILLENYNII